MKIGDMVYFNLGVWVILGFGKSKVKMWNIKDNRIGHITQAHARRCLRKVTV